jgi:hypothetical protein
MVPMPPSESDPTLKTPSDASRVPDGDFFWDWYKHEEDLATNRGNFFLVGQSMLFAAYATLRAAVGLRQFTPIRWICYLGIFGACIWLLLSASNLVKTRMPLIRALQEYETRIRIKFKSPKAFLRQGSFYLMHALLPIGILVTWVVLLINK